MARKTLEVRVHFLREGGLSHRRTLPRYERVPERLLREVRARDICPCRGDSVIGAKTTAFFKACKQRHGSPRIHADLKAAGERVSRKRVARLMRENGQRARTRLRYRTTTDSKHEFPIAPNLLARDFTAVAPNQKWVTDTTFIFTMQGWLYLAVILDLFSRRVVGWAVSQNIDRHLALSALEMATVRRRPPLGIIHSDRGSTYASADYSMPVLTIERPWKTAQSNAV